MTKAEEYKSIRAELAEIKLDAKIKRARAELTELKKTPQEREAERAEAERKADELIKQREREQINEGIGNFVLGLGVLFFVFCTLFHLI